MTLSVDPKINWTMDVMPSAIQMENFPVAGLTVAGADSRQLIVIVVKNV